MYILKIASVTEFASSPRDRKRKRFVGQTGREANTKKIKTESGRMIAASYKSQSYQQWRERHKIDTILAGEEKEGEDSLLGGEGFGQGRRKRGRQGPASGRGSGGRNKKMAVGDLKTNEQILKKRKKKEFQASRRSEKKNRGTIQRGRGRKHK